MATPAESRPPMTPEEPHREPTAGLPAPTDAPVLAASEAPPDAAEADILARGKASLWEVAWLGLRQFLIKGLARLRELRPRALNLSWLTDSLAVGGAFRAHDVRRLRALGITAVVDLRREACDDPDLLARQGIQLLHLPTPDTHPPSQEDLDRGVEWVLEQQAAGHKVFVH